MLSKPLSTAGPAVARAHSSTYRPDVDGLRALAIIPVVLYHAAFGPFGGGYIGVDVFFVISGYLITRIIVDEVERTESFSFLNFYERRVRRILPAFIAMLAVTTVAAAIVLLPRVLKDFGTTAVAASLFGANIYFWKTAGYFSPAADRLPLLHTWSLSVEEQFYIVHPIMLILLRRWLPRAVVPLIALGTGLSFALSVYAVNRSPPAAFFLTPLRAWELGLGALISLGAVPSLPDARLRNAAGVVGLLMIAAPVLLYSNTTVFPGAAALPPCLGAALLIHAGQSGPSLATRLLSIPPLVAIGLISYSLYLWHWPLFLFARYAAVRDLTLAENAMLVAVAVAIATLSWRYVEMPFRRRAALPGRKRLFAVAASATAVLAICGVIFAAGDGLPWRVPADVIALDRAGRDPNFDGSRCHDIMEADIRADRTCRIGDSAGPATWMVWGDSEAWSLKPAIEQWMRDNSEAGWISSRGGCPPLIGVVRRAAPPCLGPNDATLDFIERHKVSRVLLIAAWPGYPLLDLSDTSSRGYSPEETRRVLNAAIDRTLAALAGRGVRVYVFDWVPGAKRNVPDTLARARYFGRSVEIRMTLDEYRSKFRFFDQAFARNAGLIAGRFAPAKALCPDGICQIVTAEGVPLYSDANHPSSGAAAVFAAILRAGYAPYAADLDGLRTR